MLSGSPFTRNAMAQEDALRMALQNQKRALEIELGHVRQSPGQFYLVIDVAAQSVFLKADANLLRHCPILRMVGPFPPDTQKLYFVQRVDPLTTEPGNHKHRLRSRPLPLDFRGRLIEGPRNRSRLYIPPICLQSQSDLPLDAPAIVLDAVDIKALGSALGPNRVVIWLPTKPLPEPAP